MIKIKYHNKNNNKKFLNSLLFIDESEEALMTNLTFNKDTTNIEEFKNDLVEYCREHSINAKGCENLIELIINTIFNKNDKSVKNINITLKCKDSKFEINLKDNGKDQNFSRDNLDSLAKDYNLDYTINHINVIGLNVTKLTINY